jgi:uncharacterized protein (TIGR02246 family)
MRTMTSIIPSGHRGSGSHRAAHGRRAALATVIAGLIVATVAADRDARAQQPVARPAAAAPSRQQDEAAIRDAIRRYQDALDRGDGAALAALWMPDGDIVDDQGAVLPGRDTVGLIKPPAGPTAGDAPRAKCVIKETKLRFLATDVAVEDGTVEITPPGEALPHQGRFSAVWVRHEGSWKLSGIRESRIDVPHDAPRLADLDWMVGDWTVVEQHPARDADAAPAAAGAPTIDISVRWNATRTFLIRDMKISPPATAGGSGDAAAVMQITQRIGWDPLSRQIKSWVFGSDGGHGEATWTREGSTWIARTMNVLPDGTQTSSTNIYAYDGADRCTWRSLPTHVGGEHAPQISMTMIRKQPRSPTP